MKKIFLLFILCPLVFQAARAQKPGSVFLNIKSYSGDAKNYGKLVPAKDKADFLLKIITPADSSSGVKINTIQEFHPNGRLWLSGAAVININLTNNGSYISLKFVGSCVNFYPDGKLYTKQKYGKNNKICLVECRDSTGKVITTGGNGKWVKYDDAYQHIIEEGNVADSLEEGNWDGFINDSAKYTRSYHKGEFIPTADTTGQICFAPDKMPEFIGGMNKLYDSLAKNIRYPLIALENRIHGRVYVTFTVEKDGSLTNIGILTGPDKSLNDEARRVTKLFARWIPGLVNNKPARVHYTLPVKFDFLNL